jgi:hypothetical protein
MLTVAVTGMKCKYVMEETCSVPDRDTMFRLYNAVPMYPGREVPDPKVLDLGVQFHGIEQYIRERLMPALGLS